MTIGRLSTEDQTDLRVSLAYLAMLLRTELIRWHHSHRLSRMAPAFAWGVDLMVALESVACVGSIVCSNLAPVRRWVVRMR